MQKIKPAPIHKGKRRVSDSPRRSELVPLVVSLLSHQVATNFSLLEDPRNVYIRLQSAPEQSLYRPDDNADHGKAHGPVLNPGSGSADNFYTGVVQPGATCHRGWYRLLDRLLDGFQDRR